MNKDKIPEKLDSDTSLVGGGLKRRDLLLSGSSLVATSALSAVGLTNVSSRSATVQRRPPLGKKPNIVVIMGDDIGMSGISAPTIAA